ncbi:lethal giant larvae like, C-terminal-domain-containing protein [Kockovaella imperatae]|uniref:Lethal giant larvae like, C-terminal-domain-containing protein n=1 Tax=Kockovaella imperatae TaxID=4999 RepID=A0A1Y1UIX7_9TREE|nr:lethal giant larvae like, C-terminal-domain-containing protein [Kockovaella imperatae]ORX37991.1 lethal giant larvae like, C-terminal-domain-containing protein [Kockovaella imperatae]
MFKKAPVLPPDRDFTQNLREISFYRYGHLRTLGLTGEVTAIAIDPVLSLFGVGTSSGIVHVYGNSAFQFSLPVESGRACAPVKFLLFHPGHHRLIVIDEANTLHTFSLSHISDHTNPLTNPPLPVKEGSYTLWGTITAVEQPSPSYTHLFVTMKDGTTLSWDLSRRILGNWKIENCWMQHEQRMIRSGIPSRRGINAPHPMGTCMAMNPRDLNILLIGYEGGVVAWNIQKAVVEKTFEMILPPGAPGGGTYNDADQLWTERAPSVTCIAWRPDGLLFAVGHSDGCMAFWAYAEPDKPLMVRTITHEDVNVTDADELFSAGVLDSQIRSKEERQEKGSAVSANREPIFKLAWASFPDQPSLKALIAAQGTEAAGEPLSNATVDYAERGETLLLILGGQSPGEPPGINIIQFPAYIPPPPPPKIKGVMQSESLPLQDRYAFRDSLAATGTSNFVTRTPPEDFVLLPRSSPYFALSHDPIALIISLTPDPKLSRTTGPTAERGIECYKFPPPRSGIVPPSPGRKNYVQPGEGERLVAMTPAPMTRAGSASPRSASPSLGGWKLPWSSSAPSSPNLSPTTPNMARTPSGQSARAASPMLRVPTPDSFMSRGSSALGPRKVKERKRYRNPSSLWSGNMTVMGCELHSLPTPVFKRFIAWTIEQMGDELVPRLPLRGGMAVPDLQSHGAPEVKVAKMENYRVLMTWHPDATVRFWDISPHLLLLPTPLRFEYPGPLPHLTISLGSILQHSDVAHLPIAKLWKTDRAKVRIASVHLAREALECTITMTTGEVIVTKFQDGDENAGDTEDLNDDEERGYFPRMNLPDSAEEEGYVEEITEIGHLAKTSMDGFRPVAIITLKRGEARKCAVSDIGFIAVSYENNSLAIVDMRGPDVILREGFDSEGVTMKKKKKKGNVQNVPGESSPVAALKWVVAGLGTDSTPRPRLVVSYAKGMTKIYTLVNVLGEWMVEAKPPTFTNDSLANPIASFVVDPLTGNEMSATAEALSNAMKAAQSPGPEGKAKDVPPHCLWIAVSRKSIRVAVNFNGDKVGKVELDDEELSEAFYITRHGKKILVGLTTKGTALFYSLPFLEFVTRLDLYYGHNPRSIGRIVMDDRSGDFIEHSSPLDINLRTLFHFRKPFPPRIDPCAVKHAIPAQPQPLSASYFGWMWGAGPLTGAQLDSIVAGPARPPPPPPPPAPRRPLISWGEPPAKAVPKPEPTPSLPSNTLPKRTAVTKTKNPILDAREREDAYSEMRRAAEERGTFLDGLNDSMNNVQVSAGNYLTSARNAAMKEAAKSTAKGVFGKLL